MKVVHNLIHPTLYHNHVFLIFQKPVDEGDEDLEVCDEEAIVMSR
jgi:hypothetical protein